MTSKAGKLTAGKARERIEGLRESITSRRHRLEQLRTRLDRSDVPDERLLTAKARLERRIEQEEEQLEKLLRLLDRQESEEPDESVDFEAEEEIEDLHRSFEEIRQDLVQLQARLDSNPELPRDLDGRLAACESRISRREAVDSELFARVMSLQTALDQERQSTRRLARRFKDQEQNMEALREAVEDAVVTTVDLAERLEELAEMTSPVDPPAPPPWVAELDVLRSALADSREGLEHLRAQTAELFETARREHQELREQHQKTASSLADCLEQLEHHHHPPSLVASQNDDLRPALLAQAQAYTKIQERLQELEKSALKALDQSPLSQRLEALEAKLEARHVDQSPAVPTALPEKPVRFAPSHERTRGQLAVFATDLKQGR